MAEIKPQLLVSACVAGFPTRFDGKCISINDIVALVDKGMAIPFCAEQAAGFPTPRDPAEIEPGKTAADVLAGNARVFTNKGEDVTKQFINGAYHTLARCQEAGITVAILRQNSPSCGSTQIYDGTFSGTRIDGSGVVTELLSQNGITVYNHDNYPVELVAMLLES